ncbi:LamG domain-containing protein [Nostoc sp.]|uniref:LamG domain-containing protein n=1 Tax=Nostoc sp. TaxID=1180 RepID=UPI002FFBF15F
MPLFPGGLTIPTNILSVADNADKLLMVDSNSELFAITKENFLNGISTTKEYFDNLVFLAHFNGDDNSTTITDVKGATITRYGDSKISTAESKFGNGSLLLDGAGDYLSFPYSDAIDINSDDFKIECWYYPLAITGFRTIFAQWQQITAKGGFLLAANGSSLLFDFGAFAENADLLTGGTLTINTWHHIAVTRIGSRFTLWLNGVAVKTALTSATKSLTTVNFSIGNFYNSSGVLGAAGATDTFAYINELRIAKPTPFALTVPDSAFLDS